MPNRPAALLYLAAADADGSQWQPPVKLQPNGLERAPSMIALDGRAALTYFDVPRASLEYARAVPSGWQPEMHLEQPAGTTVFYNDSRVCDSVPAGSRSKIEFKLWNINAGSADLLIEGLRVDSPTGEFSVSLPAGGNVVPAGGFSTITVEYVPRSAGTKSGTLAITTNAGLGPHPFQVLLSGNTLPGISVELTGGPVVEKNGTLDIPVTPVGSTADVSFTLWNSGPGDLDSLSLLIDGRDSAEFPLVSAPASSVPVGASTTYYVASHPGRPGIENDQPPSCRQSSGTVYFFRQVRLCRSR
jgi:hypothetical protein